MRICAAGGLHFSRREVASASRRAASRKNRRTMKSLLPQQDRQGIDYAEKAGIQNLHSAVAREQGETRITIQPFSLSVLVICGVTIFFAGFFSARYGVDFASASTSPGTPKSTPSPQTVHADANPASTVTTSVPDAKAAAIVHVVMRNMKFVPAAVEVKSGDVVEWKNEDITPHTATFASFDSASIDPDKSWKHTFSEPGNFPYNCTFHPEMKAVVTVK
jgi:plastocyanin